jgi:predicted adenylyl cyclase CyaB
MGKSLKNAVTPDDIVRDYGADCFRLYEMYMGPLEASKPWNTRDIIGMTRFLNAIWRHFVGDEENNKVAKIDGIPVPDAIDRQMHRTIKKVGEDVEAMRFNTAIAELIKLNNEIGKLEVVPRDLAENFALMLAPFAPHIAEELWLSLGHHKSLARRPWPTFDPAKLQDSTMELPVQVNGKLRGKITIDASADEDQILAADKGLRVRKNHNVKTGHDTIVITHKGPRQPGPLKTRTETELEVSNLDDTVRLFEAIGYQQVLSFQKRRESWQLGKCRIELDEVPHLGPFVEIEGPSEAMVMQVRQELGLSQQPIVKSSYTGLLMSYLQEHGETERTVRFSA